MNSSNTLTSNAGLYLQLETEKRHDKINANPYAKRTAGCITATSALQYNPVGAAPRTKHSSVCRFLEYSQLVSRHVTRADRSAAPHMNLTPRLFFFNDTAPTEIYTLSLHDALLFFFKEHAADLHSHCYLLGRLPV